MTAADLRSPIWRLQNLYHIKDADTGRVIKFAPRPEQMQVFRAIHEKGHRRIIILKARRLGMSTGIDVAITDQMLWNAGYQASIIDRKEDDAEKKLNGICKVAFGGLPEILRDKYQLLRDNDSAFQLQAADDTPSAIYAGKNARGGTNQFLHISEWGPIQADDPRRSEEILTGAIPSAEHGIVVVETTWKGGKGGHLWTIVKPALETPEAQKGPTDWRVMFFPWWIDPTYEIPPTRHEPPDLTEYLNELEARIGGPLSPGQRAWYGQKRETLGIFIFREFPSTIEECFRSPIEGAIYAQELDRIRSEGAIGTFGVDKTAPVHTFWDEGSPINTVTWYAQFVRGEIRLVDIDIDLDIGPVERVAHIRGKGYALGNHYLTHAAAQTEKSGRSFEAQLAEAGLTNMRVVPRTPDVWSGINDCRQLMPRMCFRLPACQDGIEALENYHLRRITTGGRSVDEPVHDWTSHTADALRTMAEAIQHGMVPGGGSASGREAPERVRQRKVKAGFRG
jgi:hypothetical protein